MYTIYCKNVFPRDDIDMRLLALLVQDFDFKLLSIWILLFFTKWCPVRWSAIYLLCTSVLFVSCVCLLEVSHHFQAPFSVLLVCCQIASYQLSFLCAYTVYTLCDYVCCFCLSFVLLRSLKVIFRDINKSWMNEWTIRYMFTFSGQLKHFQFNSVATVVKMPFLWGILVWQFWSPINIISNKRKQPFDFVVIAGWLSWDSKACFLR